MSKYVINPEYIINEGDDTTVEAKFVFTPNMEKIYVLQEVEATIVEAFTNAKSMDEAVAEIQSQFTPESFVAEECKEFIQKLLDAQILVNAEA